MSAHRFQLESLWSQDFASHIAECVATEAGIRVEDRSLKMAHLHIAHVLSVGAAMLQSITIHFAWNVSSTCDIRNFLWSNVS